MSKVQAIPDGYASAIPYLTVKNAAAAIEFYQRAFAAELVLRLDMPGGSVMHAELRIGQALFMLSEQNDEWGSKSPDMLGGTPVTVMVYVPDVDQTVAQAVAAGAKLLMPVADQFYGDRSAALLDPFGHGWMLATHIEDLSQEEIDRWAAQLFSQ